MTRSTNPMIRLGTRGSPLALAQAQMVRDALQVAHGGALDVRVEVVTTTGDRVQDRPLAEIGGKALWTKELDGALLARRIDLAVHSMKDVETDLARGIALVAVLPRADPRDRLIGATSIETLADGAVVGTSSPRRAAQLRWRRPDLAPVLLRGNVATRLAAVAEGRVTATFLAAAGLARLGIEAGQALDMAGWLPAAAQGIVGMTIRSDDADMAALLGAIDHPATHRCLLAERGLLAVLGGSCHTSIAAHARLAGDGVRLDAQWLLPDGTESVTASAEGKSADTARAVAEALLAAASPALRATLAPPA